MFSFLSYYPYKKLSKGGGIMTKIQALSALLAGTVLFSSTGCSLGKNKEKIMRYRNSQDFSVRVMTQLLTKIMRSEIS